MALVSKSHENSVNKPLPELVIHKNTQLSKMLVVLTCEI